MRLAAVQAVGVLLVVVGASFTARTVRLTREGHLTDRFKAGADLLGGAVPVPRAGGVLALERIGHDSRRDHPAVVELLSLFARKYADDEERALTVTVLGRRSRSGRRRSTSATSPCRACGSFASTSPTPISRALI